MIRSFWRRRRRERELNCDDPEHNGRQSEKFLLNDLKCTFAVRKRNAGKPWTIKLFYYFITNVQLMSFHYD